MADGWKPETICSTRARKTVFSSTRAGGKGGESRELHRVGASKSSASTTTDTNISFATPCTTKGTVGEIWGSKALWRIPVNLLFFHVKPNDFMIHVISQVWSSTTVVWCFRPKGI